MDYSKLKQEIKEIADISASVPDPFKQKCFEVLLNKLLERTKVDSGKKEKEDTTKPPLSSLQTPPAEGELPIPTQLRVFMQRTGIKEDNLKALLMVADNDVHFLKEPAHGKIADGQVQWAMLLALKNCVLNNNLSVDPEDVRSICQEKGFYDPANFAAIFKRPKYAKLFKGTMDPQGSSQLLSNEGQSELASLIKSLIAI